VTPTPIPPALWAERLRAAERALSGRRAVDASRNQAAADAAFGMDDAELTAALFTCPWDHYDRSEVDD
jgi:hypothetical protein